MKLHKLNLVNFRGFKKEEIKFHPEATLFIGVNGAGKTTCLDAIVIFLSHLISAIRQKRGTLQIKLKDISIGKKNSALHFTTAEPEFVWTSVKHAHPSEQGTSQIVGISDYSFVDYKKSLLQNLDTNGYQSNIPVFAFYSTNRAVLDIPLRIRKKHEFQLLEAYDGALQSAVNFRSFFEWFRNREDLENEIKIAAYDSKIDLLITDPQLEAVRKAIQIFIPGFSELKVKRNPLRMIVKKEGKELEIGQLSDGEKCTLALVGDLARRLSISNPSSKNPLEGEGIVLIDEIELHLHPKWQRDLVGNLRSAFPNVQFILTTHSPQAVGELPHECIRLLSKDEMGNLSCITPNQTLGLTTNEILEEIMDAPVLDKWTQEKTSALYRLIDEEKWIEADVMLNLLLERNGWTPELRKAEALMGMMKSGFND
jgi:predicted ATP-binding protein involved in virulence